MRPFGRGAKAIIEAWRKKIDELDARIVEFLNERTRYVIKVGREKKGLDQPVRSPGREREVIERVLAINSGPLDEQAVRRVYEAILEEARRVESRYADPDRSSDESPSPPK